jgi:hypothetical protein
MCNETEGKWCKNKHGALKKIDTFETYHRPMGLPWLSLKVAREELVEEDVVG